MTYRSQADAVRDARAFIWGENVPISRREWHGPRSPYSANDHRGIPQIAVTADVNGRLVLIMFDQYGRQFGKVKVLS